MSKERARRRAAREAAAAAEAERRRRQVRARERRAAVTRTLRRPGRWAAAPLRATVSVMDGSTRSNTALGRARRREDGVLLAVLLGAHAVVWLLTPSWWLRLSAVVLTALLWPVLTVLFFDRRPTR